MLARRSANRGCVPALLAIALLAGTVLPTRAGMVVELNGTPHPETGSLTLSNSGIHLGGAQSRDVDWAGLLEADFSNKPFHIPYFSSDSAAGNPLPAGWVTKSLDSATPTGTATFANGVLTISGDGVNIEQHPDHFFFAGLPWEGDGQWTAHFSRLDPAVDANTPSNTLAVFVVRAGLNAGDHLFGVGVTGNGNETFLYGGGSYHGQLGTFPITLRFTRFGDTLETSFLDEGRTWKVIGEDGVGAVPSQCWLGFMVNSFDAKNTGTATIDQISFTPVPAQPELVRHGILLKTGSLLAGGDFHLQSDGGAIVHGDQNIVLKPDQVAAAIIHPVTLEQIRAASGPGVILRNGDFLEGDLQSAGARDGGGMIVSSSVTAGLQTYYSDQACAVVTGTLQPKASDYEVRLYDGSLIRVTSLTMTGGKLQLHEVGGEIAFTVDPSEVAQIRVGRNRAQPLIETRWKVIDPPAPTAIPAANAIATATNYVAPAPGPYRGDVVTWDGPAREQILVAPAGTKIDFPLAGKFESIVARLALAPGSPDGAKLGLRALVNGKEVARIAPITSTSAPVLVRFAVSAPKSLVLAVDAGPTGARLLLIDPLAVNPSALRSSPQAETQKPALAPSASAVGTLSQGP